MKGVYPFWIIWGTRRDC